MHLPGCHRQVAATYKPASSFRPSLPAQQDFITRAASRLHLLNWAGIVHVEDKTMLSAIDHSPQGNHVTVLEPLLLLHPFDNVAVARRALHAGETLNVAGRALEISEAVPANHKVALYDIREREIIRKFGQPIGSASTSITRRKRR